MFRSLVADFTYFYNEKERIFYFLSSKPSFTCLSEINVTYIFNCDVHCKRDKKISKQRTKILISGVSEYTSHWAVLVNFY